MTEQDPTDDHSSASAPAGLHTLARRGFVAVFGLVLVLSALTLFADARELGDALSQFSWPLIVPILLLAVWNDGLRFVKWQFFLREIGVRSLPRWASLRIFLAGFAMVITPGKVGEFVKAIYVRRHDGTPVNRTMAVIVAERATDALALVILAGVGTVMFSYGRLFLLLMVSLGVVGVVVVRHPGWIAHLTRVIGNHPVADRFRVELGSFVSTMSHLFGTRRLSYALGLSVLSWLGECVALFLVLIGLGVDGSLSLFLAATFTLAVSSLAGGASMLPGGLGVADASMTGILLVLIDDEAMNRGVAVAATLLIRFATLWFAVLVGIVALVSLEREHRKSARLPATSMQGEA